MRSDARHEGAGTATERAREVSDRDGAAVSDAGEYVERGVGTPDRLARLWAPYRQNYIVSKQPARSRDPFLEVPKLSDEDGLIVARGETVFCVLNLYPYNAGHMMVIPFRKESNLEDLTPAESQELMAFAQQAIRVLKRVSHPDAVNIGLNLGRASGGSVGDHLHLHIVPRWSGDANFMTVIDGTKVLPQVLRETRALLAGAWREIAPERRTEGKEDQPEGSADA